MRNIFSFWPYAFGGVITWLCFRVGIHPALGLLFMVPVIPHAESDFAWVKEEGYQHDLLNDIEHSLKYLLSLYCFSLV